MTLHFLVISDSKYICYLATFVCSMHINMQNTKYQIHAVLINCQESDMAKYPILTKTNINLNIEHHHVSLPTHHIVVSTSGKKITAKAAYCANIRGYFMWKYILQFPNIIYIDVDAVVRKDLAPLFSYVQKSDLLLFFDQNKLHKYQKTKNKKELFGCIKSGIIGMKSNNKTINFAQKYADLIKQKGYFQWYQDQIVLLDLYLKYRHTLSIYSVSKQFIDWDFCSDSFIWTGKGDRKINNKHFVSEWNKYYTQSQMLGNFPEDKK